jgi:magnesium chelatase subunit D
MEMEERVSYPFTAIVSLEDLKLALVLNAVNPKIGGLLIRGSKGSGKTTAVRALARVLPKVRTVKDCPFKCSPDDPSNMCERCSGIFAKNGTLVFEEKKMRVVELPLGATEDRVVGSLDVEKALKLGVEALEPGILAEANQNILYVDEVNLLPDHIADDLLDAAATGWNVVEREGISVKHPSRFIFIGTMNPEEGQLRPQLLDRLPLSVEAQRISDANERIEVVKRNIDFESDPEGFVKKYDAKEEDLKNRIIQARKILERVYIQDKFIRVICEVCLELKVDGMRPDIVITKTAKTLAAFENRTEVVPEHILKAAELALGHRTREGGFLEPATPQEIRESLITKLEEAKGSEGESTRTIDEIKSKRNKPEPGQKEEKKRGLFPPFGLRRLSKVEKEVGKTKKFAGSTSGDFLLRSSDLKKGDFLFDPKPEKGGSGAAFPPGTEWSEPKVTKGTQFIDRIRESKIPSLKFLFRTKKFPKRPAISVGKRAEAITATHRGRTRGWKMPSGTPSDIYFPATIRAAARMQRFRDKTVGMALTLCPEDVREKLRIYRAPMTIVFVLDLSESMLHSLDEIKEVMLKLHADAYRYRDKVGIVTFKEMGAVVTQHPTTNLKLVSSKLLRLRMSGFTPLASGMQKALQVLIESKRRDLSTIPVMAIITDGEANVPLKRDLQTGDIRQSDLLPAAFYKYEDEAIKDVLSISQLMRKESIYTVVINTLSAYPRFPTNTGLMTTQMIASITDGLHYEASDGVIKQGGTSVGPVSEAILKAQKSISHFHYLSARAYLTYEAKMRSG